MYLKSNFLYILDRKISPQKGLKALLRANLNYAALSQKRTEFIYSFVFGDGSQQKQTFKTARQTQ